MNLSPERIESLKKLASQKACMDDFDPESGSTPDYYTGNEDDTYGIGVSNGRIELARVILKELGISYK